MNATVTNSQTSSILPAILSLERACFPASWQYPDAEDFFSRVLRDPNNIHVCLEDGPWIAGYALGIPFDAVLEELVEHDPELKADRRMMYLETLQVHPDFHGMGGGKMLLRKMVKESGRRGYAGLSMHARCANHFNRLVKDCCSGRIVKSRGIPKWPFGGNERYEYIEIAITNTAAERRIAS